jgi:predicted DNA-binding WGR domain protein
MRGFVGLALGAAVQSEDHLPLAKTLRFRQGRVPMKPTEDVRKYAAEQGITEEEALKKGMEEKSKGFVEKSAEIYAKV